MKGTATAIAATALVLLVASSATVVKIPMTSWIESDQPFNVSPNYVVYTVIHTDDSITPGSGTTMVQAEMNAMHEFNWALGVMCSVPTGIPVPGDTVLDCVRGQGAFSGNSNRDASRFPFKHDVLSLPSEGGEQFILGLIGFGRSSPSDPNNSVRVSFDFKGVGPSSATTKTNLRPVSATAPTLPPSDHVGTHDVTSVKQLPFLTTNFESEGEMTITMRGDAAMGQLNLIGDVDPASFHVVMNVLDTGMFSPESIPMYGISFHKSEADAAAGQDPIASTETRAPVMTISADLSLPDSASSIWFRVELVSDSIQRVVLVSARLSPSGGSATPTPPQVILPKV